MISTFPILICCLYALSAVEATPFSTSGSVEVQQGNAKAAIPLSFWSDDKNDDDDEDDKWSKDDVGCASRSVSVLIGTSTYAIPCLQGDSIVNLNGLIPNPTSSIASSSATESSSSAVSSSAIDSSSAASSSEPSSATDITTTTDSITTTTSTTTSTESVANFAVTLYISSDCMGVAITTSYNSGCHNQGIIPIAFSVGTSSITQLKVDFYRDPLCLGAPVIETNITSGTCSQYLSAVGTISSYSVTIV